VNIPDEAAAYEYLEELRWNGKPVCPHCGESRCWFLCPANGTARATRTDSPTQRRVWKCAGCRRQFSVLTKTHLHGLRLSVRTLVLMVADLYGTPPLGSRAAMRKYGVSARTVANVRRRVAGGLAA
jgi:transposase-like protein